MNLFEHDALINNYFKECVYVGRDKATINGEVMKDKTVVKSDTVSGTVYLGKFFTLLGGTANLQVVCSVDGGGDSTPSDLTFTVTNNLNNEIQIFSFSHRGVYNTEIQLEPRSSYTMSINVSGNAAKLFDAVYVDKVIISFDVKEKPNRYIVGGSM